MSGTAAGLHTLRGYGEVQLSNADVYELPVMVALLKVLNLKPPDTNAFTTSDFQFRLEGEHVCFEQSAIQRRCHQLGRQRRNELEHRVATHAAHIAGRSDMQLPIWKNVIGGASEQIMQIQVTGTLADPKMKREPFPGINQAIQSLQTGMQPQNRTLPAEGMRANSPGYAPSMR